MTESKRVHIGQLTSIVEGHLCIHSKQGFEYPMKGIYDILNFMTGEDLAFHALPRIKRETEPVLLAEFPWLADVGYLEMPDNIVRDEKQRIADEWLDNLAAKYGEWFQVYRMHPDDHESIDPLDEPILDKLKDSGRVISIELPEDEEPPNPIGDINF